MNNLPAVTLTLLIEQTREGGFRGYLEEVPGIIQVAHCHWKGAYLLLLYQLSALLIEYEDLARLTFVTKIKLRVEIDPDT
jgi:hypothetical protein